ncbi:hypothetical protein [Paenibacillus sp. IHBB 10380]|uniref:hypothetical protein n=1 Tax=Paenibacillus sp. IHBB 10380 TaxID=1566358 RepID=UPI0005CF9FDA|nr:hypothetical protein [Paenibacillus sp. IHBB 10380]AJS57661.1 hypothetical protein UB51_03225 [Paenibacillus sp. IHBB 10380]
MSRMGRKVWGIVIWTGMAVLLGMQLSGLGKMSSSEPEVQVVPNTGQQQQITIPIPKQNQPTGVSTYTITLQPNPVPSEEQNQTEISNIQKDATPQQILIPEASKPTVDVLADKTANLLQQASEKSIRFVVSLFSSATE